MKILFFTVCVLWVPLLRGQTADRFVSVGVGSGLHLPRAQPTQWARSVELGYGWEYGPTRYLQAQLAWERAGGSSGELRSRATHLRLGASLGLNVSRVLSPTLYQAEDHRTLWYAVFYAGAVHARVTAQPAAGFAGGTRTLVYPELGPGGGVNIGLNERAEVYILLHYLLGVARNPTGYYDAARGRDPLVHKLWLTATFRGLLGEPAQQDKRNWSRLRYRKKWRGFGNY